MSSSQFSFSFLTKNSLTFWSTDLSIKILVAVLSQIAAVISSSLDNLFEELLKQLCYIYEWILQHTKDNDSVKTYQNNFWTIKHGTLNNFCYYVIFS